MGPFGSGEQRGIGQLGIPRRRLCGCHIACCGAMGACELHAGGLCASPLKTQRESYNYSRDLIPNSIQSPTRTPPWGPPPPPPPEVPKEMNPRESRNLMPHADPIPPRTRLLERRLHLLLQKLREVEASRLLARRHQLHRLGVLDVVCAGKKEKKQVVALLEVLCSKQGTAMRIPMRFTVFAYWIQVQRRLLNWGRRFLRSVQAAPNSPTVLPPLNAVCAGQRGPVP